MSVLKIANKTFRNVSCLTSDETIEIEMLTSDSNYFKHDLDSLQLSDPMLLDAWLRNYAMSFQIDDTEFSSVYPISIEKSDKRGKRIVTFKYFRK